MKKGLFQEIDEINEDLQEIQIKLDKITSRTAKLLVNLCRDEYK